MPRISYVRPDEIDDPEVLALFEEAARIGTPPPEIYGIRAHNPEIMKAWAKLWKLNFKEGIVDRQIKELCRLHVSSLLNCNF